VKKRSARLVGGDEGLRWGCLGKLGLSTPPAFGAVDYIKASAMPRSTAIT
jgi:hypothetical protein